jgi:hypothetical protein
MSLFSPIRPGSWSVYSKKDKRWNGSGQSYVGGFMMPTEATEHIERKKKELKVEPPDDLEWSYMKD